MQFTNPGEFVRHSACDNDRRLTHCDPRSKCVCVCVCVCVSLSTSYRGCAENVTENEKTEKCEGERYNNDAEKQLNLNNV